MPDRELHTRRIVLVVAAIGAIGVTAVVAALSWLSARDMRFGGERLERSYELSVPGPNLQSAPQADLESYFAEKRKRLHDLAWLDASHATARIPIEDAMKLIAAGAARPGAASTRAARPERLVSSPTPVAAEPPQ